MDRIVKEALKVDFHIHSIFSKYKDNFDLVKDSNVNNIEVLIEKLSSNKINMCSITDHDYFSYDLYKRLKGFEGKNELKRVFPGVEFSVGLKGENGVIKQVHIICLFDDDSGEQAKVKKIETIIPFLNGKINYSNESNQFFTEEKFISILREIDLNVVMIAHQKSSVYSKNASKSKNDVSSLGSVKFNELISCEYFEAYEFKNMKNGLFNKNYAVEKNKNYDQVRFITGSDCHDWNFYPKHDKDEQEGIGFNFTYLKCLPCFRGLAMSFSDTNRISTTDNLFGKKSNILESISLRIDDKDFKIPLSSGINVIIGDNSIGKSLLLHKLTNFKYLKESNVKEGYNKYLEKNNIILQTNIDNKMMHTFDYQGSIRDRFSNDSQDNTEFLSDKFPEDLDSSLYKELASNQFEKLYSTIKNKFEYDKTYKELKILTMVDEEINPENLSAKKLANNQKEMKKYNNLVNYYGKIKNAIISNIDIIEDENEKQVLIDMVQVLTKYHEKYSALYENSTKIYSIKASINLGIANFNNEVKAWKTDLEDKKSKFDNEESDQLANTISELVFLNKKIVDFNFDIKPHNIKPQTLNYGNYVFGKKFKNCKVLNNEYLCEVLKSVLNDGKTINVSTINKDKLKSIITKNRGDDIDDPLDLLKSKVNEKLEDDFKSVPTITLDQNDVYNKLSNGMNSSIYFDILSTDNKEGIYIVDQPEDDVSQTSIRKNVISNFKEMSKNRQIIMITHNPQFVVNLDVENVICLEKVDGVIKVTSGALEYTDPKSDIDILNIVAQNLDGGIDSIRKRWKRYEKTVEIN